MGQCQGLEFISLSLGFKPLFPYTKTQGLLNLNPYTLIHEPFQSKSNILKGRFSFRIILSYPDHHNMRLPEDLQESWFEHWKTDVGHCRHKKLLHEQLSKTHPMAHFCLLAKWSYI